MNRRQFLPTLPVLLLGAAAPEDDVAAIRTLLDRQVDDWNRKDLDAFCEGYWKSPKLVFQSAGDRNDGFEAMRERYRKTYQADGKSMGKLIFQNVEIVPISADAAFVRGGWHLTMADGTTPHGLFTLIVRKLPEGWKIIHDHTSKA